MTTYTVQPGEIGAHAKKLSAGAIDTVVFALGNTSAPGWANVPRSVEILTDGAADIYVTVDGSAPTLGGANCYRLPAAGGAITLDVRDANPVDAVTIKLISAGVPEYSVTRAG